MMAADVYGPLPAEELISAVVSNGRGYRPPARPMGLPGQEPTAELRGWWNFATNAAHWGGVVTMDSQIAAFGSTPSGAFHVQWYLSTDYTGSSDDILLPLVGGATSYAHGSITPGQLGSRFNVQLQLPATLPAGFSGETLHIIMKTDALGEVAEIDETNNFGAIGQNFDRDKINITTVGAGWSGFNAWDASMDDTLDTVLRDGVLRLNYAFASPLEHLSSITLEALGFGSTPITLGSFGVQTTVNGKLINLNDLGVVQAGDYSLRLKASFLTGEVSYSSLDDMTLLNTWTIAGGQGIDNLEYNGWTDTAVVMRGNGGTDTLVLNATREEIVSINGFTNFNANLTANQAIYRGTAHDFLRLTGDREIYFQGFERIKFADGTIQQLVTRPNDTEYAGQWNLHVTDVPGAWRFTTGASNILLVSLDSGVLPPAGAQNMAVRDMGPRLITDPTDDINDVLGAPPDYPYPLGHGHMAINVMSATPNNGYGIAGINHVSQVMVADVYQGATLQGAISEAIAYARANNMRVVFQGGVQGDTWWNSGGNASTLASLVSFNADIAMFAIAAGNGGPDGNLSDPDWWNSVSGIAKLETTQHNVMSVGALWNTSPSFVEGLNNADGVWLAGYSNRGSNLTIVAPTDSPALDLRGQSFRFGGTSCANPNMAAIASLVWSAHPGLMGDQLRQVIVDTAFDLGATGRDNTFGNGLVNAEAAVRRAVALARNVDVAGLYWGPGLANSGSTSTPALTADLGLPASVAGAVAGFVGPFDFALASGGASTGEATAVLPIAAPYAGGVVAAQDLAMGEWAPSAVGQRGTQQGSAGATTCEELDLAFSLFGEADALDGALAA